MSCTRPLKMSFAGKSYGWAVSDQSTQWFFKPASKRDFWLSYQFAARQVNVRAAVGGILHKRRSIANLGADPYHLNDAFSKFKNSEFVEIPMLIFMVAFGTFINPPQSVHIIVDITERASLSAVTVNAYVLPSERLNHIGAP